MISLENLRRYPFFGEFSHAQLISIASISSVESYPVTATLFHKGQPANSLYLLETGSVDLFYPLLEKEGQNAPGEIALNEVNPGDTFGVAALIEPYFYTATARTAKASQVIKIDATLLRALFEKDKRLAYLFTRLATKTEVDLLDAARVQLAAAIA
ncbi:MAG: Crp/Fnr family transcriptional regulator [Anaerolineaceae bacterium]|nr:Crp/Fnr family transcriptional regulator [Anaerolineaceae bacterium]